MNIRGRNLTLSTIAVVALLGAATAGCSSDNSSDAASGGTQITFRTPFVFNGGDAPFFYAAKLGFYKDAGLDVKITDSKGSGGTLTDVSSGGTDIGEVNAANLILGIGAGQDVTAVATTLGKSSFGFFVPKDSGITNVADLKGKSVGALAAIVPVLDAALHEAGLSADDIKLVVTDSNALITTYLSGKVDSIYTSSLLEGAVARRPTNVLLQADLGYNPPDFALVTTRAYLDKNSETVRKFVEASLRGFQAAAKDPDAAIGALLAAHPEVSKEQAVSTLNAAVKFLCSDAQKGNPYGTNSASDWGAAAASLKKFAGLKGSTDPSRFVSNELFEGAKPVDVDPC